MTGATNGQINDASAPFDQGVGVSAVSNDDGSLIVSPETGAVEVSLNLNNPNVFTADQSVPDEVYGPAWNGSVEVPTKNAVYDKIESMGAGPAIVTLGAVAFDYGATTAVKIGTTRNNGKKFIPLYVTFDIEAASAPVGVGSATLGVGVTAANYNETMFIFLDATFNAAGLFYNKFLPTSATAQAYYAANTDVYAKMGTAISGGTMTGKISITGIEF